MNIPLPSGMPPAFFQKTRCGEILQAEAARVAAFKAAHPESDGRDFDLSDEAKAVHFLAVAQTFSQFCDDQPDMLAFVLHTLEGLGMTLAPNLFLRKNGVKGSSPVKRMGVLMQQDLADFRAKKNPDGPSPLN